MNLTNLMLGNYVYEAGDPSRTLYRVCAVGTDAFTLWNEGTSGIVTVELVNPVEGASPDYYDIIPIGIPLEDFELPSLKELEASLGADLIQLKYLHNVQNVLRALSQLV